MKRERTLVVDGHTYYHMSVWCNECAYVQAMEEAQRVAAINEQMRKDLSKDTQE